MQSLDLDGLEASVRLRAETLRSLQGDLTVSSMPQQISERLEGASEEAALGIGALRRPGEKLLKSWEERVLRPLQEARAASDSYAGRLQEVRNLQANKLQAEADRKKYEMRKESASAALAAALSNTSLPKKSPRGPFHKVAHRLGKKSDKCDSKDEKPEVDRVNEELAATQQALQEVHEKLDQFETELASLASSVQQQFPLLEKQHIRHMRQAVGAAAELLATWAKESKEATTQEQLSRSEQQTSKGLMDALSPDDSTNAGNESSDVHLSGSGSSDDEAREDKQTGISNDVPVSKLLQQVRQSAQENQIRQKGLPMQLRFRSAGRLHPQKPQAAVSEESVSLLANANADLIRSVRPRRCPQLRRRLRRVCADFQKEASSLEGIAQKACEGPELTPRRRSQRTERPLAVVEEQEEDMVRHRCSSAVFGRDTSADSDIRPTEDMVHFESENITNGPPSPFSVGGALERTSVFSSDHPQARHFIGKSDVSDGADVATDGGGGGVKTLLSKEDSCGSAGSGKTPRAGGGADERRHSHHEQFQKADSGTSKDREQEEHSQGTGHVCFSPDKELIEVESDDAAGGGLRLEGAESEEEKESDVADGTVEVDQKKGGIADDDDDDADGIGDSVRKRKEKLRADSMIFEPGRQDSKASNASSEAHKGKSLFGISCCLGGLPRRRPKKGSPSQDKAAKRKSSMATEEK